MMTLHPFTALTFWAIIALQALLLPLGLPLILLASILVMCLILWKAARHRIRYIFWIMLPMALGIILVHGNILQSWMGNATTSQSYHHAMTIWWRLLVILSAAQLWMQYTPTIAMVQALFASRLPIGISYLLASPLLLMQQLSSHIQLIKDAQLTRGVRLDGNLIQRSKALTAMVFPLINLTFANLSIKIAALESKGFRYQTKRTNLWAPKDSSAQKLFRIGSLIFMILEIIGVLLWR